MNKVDQVLQNPSIRRANQATLRQVPGLPTGFDELDEQLPGGGWPDACLTEIMTDSEGVGELSLLMPALAELSQKKRWIAWIAPPHIPYAPALSGKGIDLSRVLVVHAKPGVDTLWAMEQALASGVCGAVLGWPQTTDQKALRRLQLAAEKGGSAGFLFRPASAAKQSSPAALRLNLLSDLFGLRINIHKCRGKSGGSVQFKNHDALAEPVFFQPAARPRLSRRAH